jgi:hypothetical protein
MSGCSSMSSRPKLESDVVSVQTALDHAQMSYLRGCVEGLKEYAKKGHFPFCKEKAKLHRHEIQSILDSNIEGNYEDI